jgi:hypothetical protein
MKIKYLTLILLLIKGGAMFSQSLGTTAAPLPEPDPIVRAVDSALYIVRVEYVLRSKDPKPKDYGLDDKSYFGRSYGVGVLVNGNLWIDPRILRPWIYYDSTAFQPYKADTSLFPVVKRIFARSVVGKKAPYQRVGLPEMNQKFDDRALRALSFGDSSHGFSKYRIEKDTVGTMVVLFTDGKPIAENDSATIRFLVQRTKVNFSDTSRQGSLRNLGTTNPLLRQHHIGAIYLRDVVSMGKISFEFDGLVRRRGLSAVLLLPPVTEPPSVRTLIQEDDPSTNSNDNAPSKTKDKSKNTPKSPTKKPKESKSKKELKNVEL